MEGHSVILSEFNSPVVLRGFGRFVILSEALKALSRRICVSSNARLCSYVAAVLIVAVLIRCDLAFAQDVTDSSQSSKDSKSMVTFLFPEQVTVPAGKSTAVDLHFRVADGLHINSHNPREKSLIPTNLAVVEQDGFKVSAVDFPPGTDYAFTFDPTDKLSVYTGEFVLRAHLTAPSGEHLLQGVLRYQACNSNSCFPPKTIPVAVDVIGK